MSKQIEDNNDLVRLEDSATESTPCLLCGSNAIFRKTQKGYQEPYTFKIYYCESCNTSFSLPRVKSNKVYELIYKNPLAVKGYKRYQNYQEQVITKKDPLNFLENLEPSYWGAIHAIKNVLQVDKSAHIIEVGSGLGYFTYSLKTAGYNIQGLDISQEAVNDAKKKFGNYYLCDDLFNFAEHNSESYDLVIMTEVIEHLDDPKEFLKTINRILKPNGKLITTTPNKSFYPNKISWYTDFPPVHCWWFSEKSIEYIAGLLNMKLKFVEFEDYHKKHPFISKIVNLDSEGDFIFDSLGNVIEKQNIKTNNLEMPKWLKKNKLYIYLRNFLFESLYPKIYKSGGVQSNVICAILYK
jgi:SAM-dependent methyltransferase